MALLATTLVVSAAPEGALATTAYPRPTALRKPFPSGLDVAPESIHTRAGSIATKAGGAGPSRRLGATATATVLETHPATRAAEAAVQRPEGVPGR
ncbi:hypothetical protein CPC08DRAFT_769797 [Agrocybe pediades]|nr:hypothetical protein CPC08DRAFT_769797 [Agrocybe pediades]